MKKLLIVLCCTALLLVGLFYVNFVAPTAAQANQRPVISAWDSAKVKEIKTFAAREWDCVDTIRRLPGIADACVLVHWDSKWERNVWVRKQAVGVDVFVEAYNNRPLDSDVIRIIGKIVAQAFGGSATEISIVDAKHARTYDGAGVETTEGRPQTVADLAGPNIGKFRLANPYPLHNIPAESLINFLRVFTQK